MTSNEQKEGAETSRSGEDNKKIEKTRTMKKSRKQGNRATRHGTAQRMDSRVKSSCGRARRAVSAGAGISGPIPYISPSCFQSHTVRWPSRKRYSHAVFTCRIHTPYSHTIFTSRTHTPTRSSGGLEKNLSESSGFGKKPNAVFTRRTHTPYTQAVQQSQLPVHRAELLPI